MWFWALRLHMIVHLTASADIDYVKVLYFVIWLCMIWVFPWLWSEDSSAWILKVLYFFPYQDSICFLQIKNHDWEINELTLIYGRLGLFQFCVDSNCLFILDFGEHSCELIVVFALYLIALLPLSLTGLYKQQDFLFFSAIL